MTGTARTSVITSRWSTKEAPRIWPTSLHKKADWICVCVRLSLTSESWYAEHATVCHSRSSYVPHFRTIRQLIYFVVPPQYLQKIWLLLKVTKLQNAKQKHVGPAKYSFLVSLLQLPDHRIWIHTTLQQSHQRERKFKRAGQTWPPPYSLILFGGKKKPNQRWEVRSFSATSELFKQVTMN